MKIKKTYLLLIIFVFIYKNSFSQQEDNFPFMGIEREVILNSEFNEYERIYSGNYNEVAYAINDNTAYWFYFDKNKKCNMFIIKKNKEFYERALLMLASDFPKKNIAGELHFFWNSRMMATLMKEPDHINIVYQKVAQQLLEQ